MVRQRRKVDRGRIGRMGIEQRAGSFLSGQRGECRKVLAQKQRRGAVATAIPRGDDAAAGRALRGEELGDYFGRKRRLVAERKQGAVQFAGKLLQGRDSRANGSGHPFGPRRTFRDEHR